MLAHIPIRNDGEGREFVLQIGFAERHDGETGPLKFPGQGKKSRFIFDGEHHKKVAGRPPPGYVFGVITRHLKGCVRGLRENRTRAQIATGDDVLLLSLQHDLVSYGGWSC